MQTEYGMMKNQECLASPREILQLKNNQVIGNFSRAIEVDNNYVYE